MERVRAGPSRHTGALFDAVSGALRSVEGVRLEGMPRMADFAVWVTAAEELWAGSRARSWPPTPATDGRLQIPPSTPIPSPSPCWISWPTGMSGPGAQPSCGRLGRFGGRRRPSHKAWPGAPNALTGRLKRLAPTLRGVGIEYGEDRSGRSRKKVLTKNKPAKDRHDRHHRHDEEFSAKESQMRGDGPGDGLSGGDGPHRHSDDPRDRHTKAA